MKIVVASAVASVFVAISVEGDSHVHLRVKTNDAAKEATPAPVSEWGQCKWIDKLFDCEYGLECVVSNDWYGQCIKNEADTWGQCGGSGQCVPNPDANKKVGEWAQCSWQDYTAECEDTLKCVISDNAWFGFCVKKQVDVWGQCGGYGWSSDCVAGSVCSKVDDAYSQCIPSNDGGVVGEWSQCKWNDKQVGCADDLQCAVYNDWYGQCVKKVAGVWGTTTMASVFGRLLPDGGNAAVLTGPRTVKSVVRVRPRPPLTVGVFQTP
ncbi:hypothetical protein KRP22_001456 [Phytophthora ramorum]|nr:hypothetical protein KRP22_7135 [Phytophthora ramorum]